MRPRVIGIAGPSCSGKTCLAHALSARLPEASVVAIDRYYRDCSHLAFEERARQNFDHPDAIEWPLLESDVMGLSEGRTVSLPVYDFAKHVRRPETESCSSGTIVIVEGLFALVSPVLREVYDLALFVDAPRDMCRTRRVCRDVRERGRTPESVAEQWASTVEPSYEHEVASTREFADLVLNGAHPVDELVGLVLAALEP